MKQSELNEVVRLHKLWLEGEPGGISADLSDTKLYKADLSGANLRGADLGGADLSRANLERIDLSTAYLGDADLRGANLRMANLWEAQLIEANLREANLWNANLKRANLSDANLRDADLSETNLRGADLTGADLTNCRGVIYFGAGKQLAFYTSHNNYLKIGCEGHDIDYWIDNYAEIGKAEGWDESDIRTYGTLISAMWNL